MKKVILTAFILVLTVTSIKAQDSLSLSQGTFFVNHGVDW
jgi:hypothetical protein